MRALFWPPSPSRALGISASASIVRSSPPHGLGNLLGRRPRHSPKRPRRRSSISTSSRLVAIPKSIGITDTASHGHRPSDAALAAYLALSPEKWHGRLPIPGSEIIFPDPKLARGYLAAATHAAQVNRDPVGAIRLLDVSIRLDYVDLLNEGDNLIQRIEAYAALGSDEPRRSILLYNHGVTFSR